MDRVCSIEIYVMCSEQFICASLKYFGVGVANFCTFLAARLTGDLL